MVLTSVEKFTKKTGVNVSKFLRDFSFFFSGNYYANVYQYYAGNTDTPNAEAFSFLENLEVSCKSILEKIKYFRKSINNLEDVNLLFDIEDANNKLVTVRKLPFYLSTNVGKQSGNTFEYILGKNETLLDVTKNVLESNSPENDWIRLAVSNGIYEKEYNTNGGLSINLFAQKGISKGRLESVLGVQNGKNALGVDLDKKLTFVNNDLKKLKNEETFLQSVYICLNLRKGDNTYFPNLGITEDVVVGKNVSSYNFPIIIRELNTLFAQDDTIAGFSIKDVRKENDAIFCVLEVQSVIGESETINFNIS